MVAISDTHTQKIKDMPDGDLLVHSGDYSGRGSIVDLSSFVNWMESLKDKYKSIITIDGNHDFNGEREPILTRDMFESAGIVYLNDSGVEIDGFHIWGSPVSPEFGNWAFNRNQIEIQKHWDIIPDNTNILLTHCPPYGILDKLSKYGSNPGEHVGCKGLLNTIKTRLKDLKANFFGHIHENHGQVEKYGIKFVNASSLNEHYRLVNKPIVIDL